MLHILLVLELYKALLYEIAAVIVATRFWISEKVSRYLTLQDTSKDNVKYNCRYISFCS